MSGFSGDVEKVAGAAHEKARCNRELQRAKSFRPDCVRLNYLAGAGAGAGAAGVSSGGFGAGGFSAGGAGASALTAGAASVVVVVVVQPPAQGAVVPHGVWQLGAQAAPHGDSQLGAQAAPQGLSQLGAQVLPHGVAQLGAAQVLVVPQHLLLRPRNKPAWATSPSITAESAATATRVNTFFIIAVTPVSNRSQNP